MAVADRAYASLKVLERCRRLSNPITFITRLRLDAALYEPAPPRYPRQIGRPRLKGERLANLSEVTQDPNTVWKMTKIANWYGSGDRMVEVSSATAVWYSTGLFTVPIRWVLIRDPQGGFKTQALLGSDLDADPKKIILWFVRRWQMEVCQPQYTFRHGLSYHRSRRAIRAARVGGETRSRPRIRKKGRPEKMSGGAAPPRP